MYTGSTTARITVAILVFALLTIGAVAATPVTVQSFDSAERTSISDESPAPGDTVTVEIEVEIDEAPDDVNFGVDDDFDPDVADDAEITAVTINDEMYLGFTGISEEAFVSVNIEGSSLDDGDVVGVEYEIDIPEDAEDGDEWELDGLAQYGEVTEDLGTATLTVTEEDPNFEVSIAETNAPVIENEPLNVTTIVENRGDISDTQVVEFAFAGTQIDEKEVSLDGGDQTELEFSMEPDSEDVGPRTIEVSSEDDTSTKRIDVGAAAEFVVHIPAVDPVVAGDDATIDVTFENVGDESDEQFVTIEATGDRLDDTTIELDAGESKDEVFMFDTESLDVSTVTLVVSTDDDTEIVEQELLAPALFDVELLDAPESIEAGDDIELDIDVTNVGDVAGTEPIEVFVDDRPVDHRQLAIEADETEAESFEVSTDEGDVGERDVVVRTPTATDDTVVEIDAPGSIEPVIRNITDPVPLGETLSVDVELVNTGDRETTESLGLSIDDEPIDARDVSLNGSESDYERFEVTIDDNHETGSITVDVETETEAVSESIDLITSPEEELFRLGTPDLSREVFDDEPIDVAVPVENIGDVDGSQTISIFFDDSIVDEETLSLSSGDHDTVEATIDDEHLEPGDASITATSEDSERTIPLHITQREPASIVITDVDINGEPPEPGDELQVVVELQNIGDQPGETALDLTYNDHNDEVDTALAADETTTETLSIIVPEEPYAGVTERNISVTTDDDEIQIDVPIDFGSIQSGIDAATAGDTVTVASGSYTESILVETADLTIDAPSGAEIVSSGGTAIELREAGITLSNIDLVGAGDGTGVRIDASNVSIDTVRAEAFDVGVRIDGGDGSTARHVRTVDTDVGFDVAGEGHTEVALSRLAFAETGIVVDSPNVTIRDSRVTYSDRGVLLKDAADEVVITDNDIRNNEVGLLARGGENHTVQRSNLEANEVSIVNELESVIQGESTASGDQNDVLFDATTNWWGVSDPIEGADYIDRTGTLSVTEPLDERLNSAEFAITIVDAPEEVDIDQEITVVAEVENLGDFGDIQNIELRVEDSIVDVASGVELAGSDSKTHELTVAASEVVEGTDTVTFTVRSDDTEETVAVEVIDDPSVADYTDEDDIVQTSGLREAIGDWREGSIQTDLLRAVIGEWRTGDPVT